MILILGKVLFSKAILVHFRKIVGFKSRLVLANRFKFYLFANSCFNSLQRHVTQAIIIAETKRLYLCVATHIYTVALHIYNC